MFQVHALRPPCFSRAAEELVQHIGAPIYPVYRRRGGWLPLSLLTAPGTAVVQKRVQGWSFWLPPKLAGHVRPPLAFPDCAA